MKSALAAVTCQRLRYRTASVSDRILPLELNL